LIWRNAAAPALCCNKSEWGSHCTAERIIMDESSLSLRGLALLALAASACFTGAASAQTATFGFGCTYEGHTTAHGGTVDALVNNFREYSGTPCFGGNAESRDTYYGLRWTGDYPFEYSFAQRG